MPRSVRFALAAAVIAASLTPAAYAAGESEHLFETRVRPLLLSRCGSCHGDQKQQGDLRLDLREHVLGGPNRPALVTPGDPAASRLIQVILYSPDDTQMPPRGKLPQEEIDLLTAWVKGGAYWPETPATGPTGGDPLRNPDGSLNITRAVEAHWSFRPVTRPEVPATSDARVTSEVDRFIEDKLVAAGIALSPPADRATLIRRAMLDLWGIPPTYEEVQAFVADDHPQAWPELVDKLLASPLYGQRWGRHWLDIARYADTKGYVFTENHRYPFSYTYRDYVVDSLNADLPYNQFVLEQLAADRLGYPENDPRLAALGFLTVGPRYLNREPDIIDDRIDLVGRGLMGLTVACARCHDHKYDPVPTADYYSLYGVFASSMEPSSLPLIGEVPDSPSARAFQEELDKRRQAATDYVTQTVAELMTHARARSSDYLLAVARGKSEAEGGDKVQFEHGTPRDRLVDLWRQFITRRAQKRDPAFSLWEELTKLPADKFAEQAPARIDARAEAAEGRPALNPRLLESLRAGPLTSMYDVARAYGRVFQQVDAEWQTALKAGGETPPESLPDAAAEELRRLLYGPESLTDLPADQSNRILERDHRDKLRALERKVEEWQVESPDAPPRAMVLNDKPQPQEPVIFVRGDVGRRGDRVPRQAPRVVTAAESRPFKNGSGRLELAQCIIDPQNPLTSRVIVNRVWAWHFGRGLTPTLSDFGLRGEAPSHPELLDWLAWTFMHEDGWSLKSLHRRILLSRTYQQSSAFRPEAAKVDPENQLVWRMNRQRLEFEPMRDAMLAVAGRLDATLGGRPVNIETAPFSNRRTLYATIDRNNFSSLLRTFDYPSPDATSPGRPLTTVPQQALYALNSPFLRQMSEDIAMGVTAPESGVSADPPARVIALYRQVLARDPSSEELKLTVDFLTRRPDGLPLVAQSLLMTNEFLFVD